MNLCRYLKSFCYQTTYKNSSNPEKFATKDKISKKNNPVFDSPNMAQSKSFFEKKNIEVNPSLHSSRNLISNLKSYQHLYLLGWLAFLIDVLSALIIYAPFTLGISIFLSSILIIVKHQSFFVEILKKTINLTSFTKFLKIVLIIVVGEYLVFKYYPIPSWINISLEYINSLGWLNSVSLVVIVIFSTGFSIEIYSVWEKGSKLLNITLSILGAIASFLSLYFARWIIVYLTGLEPSTFSRALVLFSIPIGIICWLLLSIVVLSLIYIFTLFIQIFSWFFRLINLSFRYIIFQIWTRKPVELYLEEQINKTWKVWIELFLFKGGRGIGAGLLTSCLLFVLIYIPSKIDLSYVIYIAETIIVYADYRPETKITECTNLKKSNWGLLMGYKKISIAQFKESGEYIFATKSCIFSDDTSS